MDMFLKTEMFTKDGIDYIMVYGPLKTGAFMVKVGKLSKSADREGKVITTGTWKMERYFHITEHNDSIVGLLTHVANFITKVKENSAYLNSCLMDHKISPQDIEFGKEVNPPQESDRGFTYTPEEVGTAMVICKGKSLQVASEMSDFLSQKNTQELIKDRRS